jgi:hypothetical protein
MEEDSFIKSMDMDKLQGLMDETKGNVERFNSICDSIVKQYSEALDNLMKDLYVDCVKNENPTLEVLERYYLELSNMMYFMNERLEALGVEADMSERVSEDKYSKGYLRASEMRDDNGKKKAVEELKAIANTGARYEGVQASIYDHAYKVVKGKMASGNSMMDTLRRIISTRTEAMKMEGYGGQGK